MAFVCSHSLPSAAVIMLQSVIFPRRRAKQQLLQDPQQVEHDPLQFPPDYATLWFENSPEFQAAICNLTFFFLSLLLFTTYLWFTEVAQDTADIHFFVLKIKDETLTSPSRDINDKLNDLVYNVIASTIHAAVYSKQKTCFIAFQPLQQRPWLREVIRVIRWHFVQVVVSRFGNTEPHVNFLLDTRPVSSEVAVLSPQSPDASLLLVTGNKVKDP